MVTRFLYRALLRLQSRESRENFGAEMLAVFDAASAASRRQGLWSYWRFCLRELGGLLSPANGAGRGAGWRWPAAGAAMGLLVGLAMTQVYPEIYTSRAMVRAVPSDIPARMAPDVQPVTIDTLRLEMEPVILSRNTLTVLIQSYDLYRAERARLPMEDVIELMQRQVELRPRAHETLAISFANEDRFKAQRVARDLMTRLIDESLRARGTRTALVVEFLRSQAERAAQSWESQMATVKAANPASASYERLLLDRDLARRRYETLRNNLADAEMRADMDLRHQGPTLEVLDLPSLPEQPSLPHWMLVVASMLVGLIAGILFGWLRALRWRAASLRARPVGVI